MSYTTRWDWLITFGRSLESCDTTIKRYNAPQTRCAGQHANATWGTRGSSRGHMGCTGTRSWDRSRARIAKPEVMLHITKMMEAIQEADPVFDAAVCDVDMRVPWEVNGIRPRGSRFWDDGSFRQHISSKPHLTDKTPILRVPSRALPAACAQQRVPPPTQLI